MLRLLVVLCFYLTSQLAFADFDSAMALYQKQDYANAFAEFETLAKQGDYAAQFNLGVMYYKGQHVARDMAQGYAWMVLATQDGNAQWSGVRDKVYEAFDDSEKQLADKVRRRISEQFSDATLKGENAVIILAATGYRWSVNNLIFAMIDSDYRVSVKFDVPGPNADIYIMHVKPGRYYLRTLGINYSNVLNAPIEQPKNINDTILVASRSATYIGDWRAYDRDTNDSQRPSRYEVNTDYSKDTVIRAGKIDPSLRKLPLYLSKAGAALVPMSWE